MDPAFSVSPEMRERIRTNAGNFLFALKTVLACLVMMRFYRLGQLFNRRSLAAAAKPKKAAAAATAADAGGKAEKAAGSASSVKRRAKAA